MSPQGTTRLRVATGATGMGPVSVEVVRGDAFADANDEPHEFTLTSGYRSHALELPQGRYAVIARRPNGERFTRAVTLGGEAEHTLDLSEQISRSPREFMWDETLRGEIASESRYAPPFASHDVEGAVVPDMARPLGVLPGVEGRAQRALTSIAKTRGSGATTHTFTLRFWGHPGARATCTEGGSLLKVAIDPLLSKPTTCAVGIVDPLGFGPIVITPGFTQKIELTFLAEAVATRAAARYLNPAGQRAPVAIPRLEDPKLTDLLATIATAHTNEAGAIWQSNYGASTEFALDVISDKFQRPVEALLAAHYVLRFMPNDLPQGWAENLRAAAPDIADGSVIAAWRLLCGSASSPSTPTESSLGRDEALEHAFRERLVEALARPHVLFARTRRMLMDGLMLLGKENLAMEGAKFVERFLNYGAHAGGLEAFWGRGPSEPASDGEVSFNAQGSVDLATFAIEPEREWRRVR